jgi:hypothetical protein
MVIRKVENKEKGPKKAPKMRKMEPTKVENKEKRPTKNVKNECKDLLKNVDAVNI